MKTIGFVIVMDQSVYLHDVLGCRVGLYLRGELSVATSRGRERESSDWVLSGIMISSVVPFIISCSLSLLSAGGGIVGTGGVSGPEPCDMLVL